MPLTVGVAVGARSLLQHRPAPVDRDRQRHPARVTVLLPHPAGAGAGRHGSDAPLLDQGDVRAAPGEVPRQGRPDDASANHSDLVVGVGTGRECSCGFVRDHTRENGAAKAGLG